MKSRLANAKRERDDLRNSEDTYKALVARGVFITERRLDMLDAMEALKTRHNIFSLEYLMSEQRTLKLAGGATVGAIDALGSRIRLKASALHDGDLVSFLDEFPRLQRGLFPIDRCVIKRSHDATGTGVTPTSIPLVIAPSIEADCALEWITLLDKRPPLLVATTPVAASSSAGAGK